MDGTTVRFAVHGYARTGATAGETAANQIAEAVATGLDGVSIGVTAPYPATIDLNWISNTVIRDPQETSAFHAIIQMEASVAAGE
jgi:hypothetical protein